MASFDIFLSHNSADKDSVERIAEKLQTEGVKPWLDKWCLVPGQPFQDQLTNALKSCRTCGIFVGQNGVGDWAREELRFAQDRATKNSAFGLIPILLPGVPEPFDYSKLPPFLTQRTWVDLRRGFDEPRLLRKLIKAIEGLPPGPEMSVASEEQKCPYRGLETFDEEHADFFFGRERDIQRLLEKLKGTRFLAVLGASGSGKSSLVRAGVIPALKEGALPQSAAWTIRVFTPGSQPLTTLAAQVLRLCPTEQAMQTTVDKMAEDERTLHLAVAFSLAGQKAGRIAWVIDQFEEVFTLCTSDVERTQFLANLLYASSIPDGRCTVLLTMRADFLPKCASYADLAARIAAQQFLVSPMNAEMFRHVIEEPARRLGLTFEPALVDMILGDVASEPGGLPLLEHALLELWKRRHDHTMTFESYRESGGVKDAIAKTAEETFKGLSPDEQPIVRRIMLRLTQLGEGTEDTRRRAVLTELVTKPEEADSVNRITRLMTDVRLLTTGGEAERYVDVAHEALIRNWPRLRQWLDEDRAGLLLHHRISEVAQEWQRSNKEEGMLYRGARLTQAQEWRERNEAELNLIEREFLDASIAERRELQRQQRHRQRLLVGALLVFALLAVGASAAAIFGFWQKGEAEKQTRVAIDAEKRTSEVASQAHVSLACDAHEAGKDAEALAHLAKALRLNPKNYGAAAFTGSLLTQVSWILPISDPVWHDATVTSAKFSPDWRRVVIASDDRTLRLCDTATGKLIGEPMNHGSTVFFAQFSADGQRVVTCSADRTVRLWDAATAKPIGEPMRHQEFVNSAQFSPDGRRVVTASDDKTARLWDALTGKAIGEPMKHEGAVLSAQFSPDGQRMLTASGDNTARLWDALTGKAIGEPMKHEGAVLSAQFSPDGQRVVTASADNTARLWDALTGKAIGELIKHENSVLSAEFSPDGQRVVTASADNTARLWDAVTGKAIGEPMKHEGQVASAQFSPDGQRVLTAARDYTVRLWDATTGNPISKPLKHEGQVVSAQFSPDGRRVLITSAGFAAQLWDATSRRATEETLKHGAPVSSAHFSADGRWVVTTCFDNTARVWDAATGLTIGEPIRHESRIFSTRFSPDSKRVVTASADNSARLWDATTGRPLGEPLKHQDSVFDAEFSPDGQRVITASRDDTARLWDATTGIPIGEPLKHQGRVVSAQFSPDSRQVVTACLDGTARFWDAATGKAIGEPLRRDGKVLSARFNVDGNRVLTVSNDGMNSRVWLWDTAACTLTGRQLMLRSNVSSAEFSPDGKRVVTTFLDNTARVWDATTGMPIGEPLKHEGKIVSAQFCPNGRRVVTASKDHTARLWDAATGKAVGESLKHPAEVLSAEFSPDGQRLLTASGDNTARLWDLPALSSDDAANKDVLLLADLAEATAGLAVQTAGKADMLNVIAAADVSATRQRIAGSLAASDSKLTPLQRFLEWCVLDQRIRAISPFSQITFAEWLENELRTGTLDELRAAMQADPSNSRLAAHFGRRLADYVLEGRADRVAARRARAEADFQTRRALKFAPENKEILNLRAEVVQLLGLTSP